MSKKYRRIKKTLALTLALVMVLGILPLGMVASATLDTGVATLTVSNADLNERASITDAGDPAADVLEFGDPIDIELGSDSPAFLLPNAPDFLTFTSFATHEEGGNADDIAKIVAVNTAAIDDPPVWEYQLQFGGELGKAWIKMVIASYYHESVNHTGNGGADDHDGCIERTTLTRWLVVEVVQRELEITAATLAAKAYDGTRTVTVATITDDDLGSLTVTDGKVTIGGKDLPVTATNLASPNVAAGSQSSDIALVIPQALETLFKAKATAADLETTASVTITAAVDKINFTPNVAAPITIQKDTFGPFVNGPFDHVPSAFETAPAKDDRISGILSWHSDGGGTALNLSHFSTAPGPVNVWWRFTPHTGLHANNNYAMISGGPISVGIFDGVMLDERALLVDGLTLPGALNFEYNGSRQGSVDENTDPYVTFNHLSPLPNGLNQTQASALRDFEDWDFTVRYWGTAENGVGYNNQTQAPIDAGEYEIRIVGNAINPFNDSVDYRIERTIKLNINQIKLQWRTGLVVDREFDGTRNAELLKGFEFSNILRDDLGSTGGDLRVEYVGPSASARFASPNVGTHVVTRVGSFLAGAGATLTGIRSHNYTLPTIEPVFGEGTIRPRNVVIYPVANSFKPWGHRDDDPTYAIGFTVPGDSLFDSADPNYIFNEVSSGQNRNQWLTRAPGTDIGEYPILINNDAINGNFNVSFPRVMPMTFAIVPAKITAVGSLNNSAGLSSQEAFTAWQAAAASASRNAQPLVDLAVSMGRLQETVTVTLESSNYGRWEEDGAVAITQQVPVIWTTPSRVDNTGAGGRGPAQYGLRRVLDLSGTPFIVNPDDLGTATLSNALNVSAIRFRNQPGDLDEYNVPLYQKDHPRNFGRAYALLRPGVTAASASDFPDLLPKEDYLSFGGVQIRYTVVWDDAFPKLDMTKPGEATFTGRITIHEDAGWFTRTHYERVEKTIEVREVLPISLHFNASADNKTYDGTPWAASGVPEVRVNHVAVADQPPASAFIWGYEGRDGDGFSSSGWVLRDTPPVNAGAYTARFSVDAYGNYARGSSTSNFIIHRRGVTAHATSDTVDRGAFVGGGLPSIGFHVENLVDGESVADVFQVHPTLRLRGFDGSKVGVYDLAFARRGTQQGVNYNVTSYEDGTITVVEPSAPTFRVSVSGGTVAGGGSFAELAAGTVVTVTADSDSSGRTFTRWSSSPSVSFASATSRTTTFVMPARDIVVTATFTSAPQTPVIPKEPIFPDLTSGPAFNAVQWAATMRIIEGRDGLFHPKAEMTRSQIVVILHRYAGRENVSATVSFTDVTPGTTIGRAVAWAVSNDITSGRSSTVFGVNDIISRESLMVMLYRYHTRVLGNSGAASANALARFSDSGDVSSTALNAIRWAVENGLLTGQGGKILPKASMTRDQLVTILYRYDKAFN